MDLKELEYVDGCLLRLRHSKTVNTIRESSDKTKGNFNKLSATQKTIVIIAFIVIILIIIVFIWYFSEMDIKSQIIIFYTWTMIIIFAMVVYFIY